LALIRLHSRIGVEALAGRDHKIWAACLSPSGERLDSRIVKVPLHDMDHEGIAVLSMHHHAGGKIEEYDFSRGNDAFQHWSIVEKILAGEADAYGDKYAGLAQTRRSLSDSNYLTQRGLAGPPGTYAFRATSSSAIARNSANGLGPRSPWSRERTATASLAASLSPTTNM